MTDSPFRSSVPPDVAEIALPEQVWQMLIVASTAAVLVVSAYCLIHGITIIFMHLFYFPIILLAYHYRYRGFLLALLLSLAYVWLVYFFGNGDAELIIGAWLRFLVFAGIAAVVAYLSEHISEDRKALLGSEKKYRTLFENMLEGFAYCRMIYDNNGKPADWEYLDVNAAFGQLTGLKDIRGKRVIEAIPDVRKLNPELFDTYGRVASTGKAEVFEINFLPLKMWLKVSVFSPEKGYFVAVFEDITARKLAEDALRESEKRYRDLFEINNAVMLIIDPKSGDIVDANGAACRYYGYSRDEIVHMKIWAINMADPDRIQSDMERAEGSNGAVFQFRHRKKNGEVRDVQVFSAPVMLGGRRLLHSIVQDVTDKKHAEDALKETNKKLNLLSSITRHDIKNQLFSLKAFLECSKDSLGNTAETSENLMKAERAASAIERQIIFTKEYQDLGVNDPVWQNIEECVKVSRDSLPLRDLRLTADVRGIEVYADPLLEKVFYNLIDNALRYGGSKMSRITISTRESGQDLVIVVEDDGNGIPAEDKSRLFTKGFGHNTGLGLFLSQEILAITGITITETGEPGRGARFEITVPKGSWRSSEGNNLQR